MNQTYKSDKRSWRRKIIFSLIPLIGLLILTEIFVRVIYFQFKHSTLGIVVAFNDITHGLRLARAKHKIGEYEVPKGMFETLYSDKGKDLLEEFQQIYEHNFVKLYKGVTEIKSKMLVVYIPSDDYRTKRNISNINVAYFTELCKRYHVDFMDLTQEFMKYPTNYVMLLPEDGHLSRFGNLVVAEEISKAMKKYDNYRSDYKFAKRPDLLGDLRPNSKTIWLTDFHLPYRVITNRQGLRMSYDLDFPKKKQRILILGDSFTFGPFLPNQDTFPELLNKKNQDKEFVNAGVAGYTIDNEASLFRERAIYTEPDVTILQVLDNDFYDLFYFRKNTHDRHRKVYLPSSLERKLLEEVKKTRTEGDAKALP